MARYKMFPRHLSRIVLLLLMFLLIVLGTVIISLVSLQSDNAANVYHSAGLDNLQEQIQEMKNDFKRSIREFRIRMDEINKQHNKAEKVKPFSVRNAKHNGNSQQKESITSSIRFATSSKKSDEELDKLLKDIILRNTESSSHTFPLNNTANELTPVRRSIPDTRHQECLEQTYPDVSTMPTVSVVIIFHDESLQLILRNIHSILDKSPPHLIHEIILVDDKSTLVYLKNDLDLYVSYLPNVRVIHNKKREGLVKSRMIGARAATGDVMVFFDAHMECNVQWLEPLLAILMEEPTAILQPLVDRISDQTIEYARWYTGTTHRRGGFGWDLRYSWFKLPLKFTPKTQIEHFWTPVLVGNAIVVKRNHFFRIGGFDEELKIWGGEHFDLSFRNWLCAGHVYTVPCSKVGHLFKREAGFSFEGDRVSVIIKNLMRVAEIWLEDYKDIFYRVTIAATPIAKMPRLTKEDMKSIKIRIELKQTLGCKPFQWYMDHVFPEQIVPRQDALVCGEITHLKSQRCLEVHADIIGYTNECAVHGILPYNTFTFTTTNQFLYEDRCVYIDDTSYKLRVNTCNDTARVLKGRWKFPSRVKEGRILFVTKKGKHFCVNSPEMDTIEGPIATPCSTSGLECDVWSFMYRLAEI